MSLPKVVLFDMDGTLIHNYDYHLEAWGQICNELGAPRSREQIIRDLHGTNFEICQKFFGPTMSFEESEEIGNRKEALYRQIYAPHIQPVNGLLPLLDKLKAAGIRLGLGTMGNKANAQFVLQALSLESYFEVVHTAEDVQRGKPHPDIFLECIKSMDLQSPPLASEFWIFEDTSSGIQSAVAAGATAWGVLTSKEESELKNCGATHCVNNYHDVMKLLS